MAEQYMLPPDIAAALATDRSELCAIYSARIKDKDPEKAELARLIGDLLTDRREMRDKAAQAQEAVKSAIGNMSAAQKSIESAAAAIRGSEAFLRA
jgi:hypothetical protein